MEFVEVEIKISPLDPFRDYFSYHLSTIGFDMFTETETGLLAYAPSVGFEEDALLEVLQNSIALGCTVSYSKKLIPWQNWNEEWEKGYSPEIIAEKVYVRADFHPSNPGYPLEIIIQPKMAFGTGHHPTTSQVMEMMLQMDFKGKEVIDMGCGTGILAILAMKLGASGAFAIDNDVNAVENTIENVAKNACENVTVAQGEAESLAGRNCDIFIANINRNIILNDISFYKESLRKNGTIITSGYYIQDLEVIKKKAVEVGFDFVTHTESKDWCCAQFKLT